MCHGILWLLLSEQEEHHAAVASDLIQTATNEPDFLWKVMTGDEPCVYSCDPDRKAQSSQWKLPGSPHLKKTQQSHRKIKTVLTVFFDWEGIVHHKYAPSNQTLNKGHYLNVLNLFRVSTRPVPVQLWATGD